MAAAERAGRGQDHLRSNICLSRETESEGLTANGSEHAVLLLAPYEPFPGQEAVNESSCGT